MQRRQVPSPDHDELDNRRRDRREQPRPAYPPDRPTFRDARRDQRSARSRRRRCAASCGRRTNGAPVAGSGPSHADGQNTRCRQAISNIGRRNTTGWRDVNRRDRAETCEQQRGEARGSGADRPACRDRAHRSRTRARAAGSRSTATSAIAASAIAVYHPIAVCTGASDSVTARELRAPDRGGDVRQQKMRGPDRWGRGQHPQIACDSRAVRRRDARFIASAEIPRSPRP